MTLNMQARISADGKQAQAELAKTARAAGHLSDEVEDIGRKAPVANRATSAFAGNGLRQVSMQLSQVAQQGAATGNFLQAMTIQAADIGLAFGTAGVAIGALIPVAYSLGQGFLGAGADARSAEDGVADFVDALSVIKSYADTATTGLTDLRREFGAFSEDIRRASQLAAQAAVSLAFDEFDGLSEAIRADLSEVMVEIDRMALQQRRIWEAQAAGDPAAAQNFRDALAATEDKALELLSALGLTAAEARNLSGAFDQLSAAQSMEEVAAASAGALDLLRGMYGQTEAIPPEVAKIISNLEAMLRAASAGVVAMEDIADATDNAATSARVFVGEISRADLSAVGGQAAFLAHQMGIAASEAVRYNTALNLSAGLPTRKTSKLGFSVPNGQISDVASPIGPTVSPTFGDPSRLGLARVRPLATAPGGGGGGGGGGGAASAVQAERDAVAGLVRRYEEKLAILRETDPVQQEMIRLRDDLAAATDSERAEIEALIREVKAEEAAKAKAAEASDFLRANLSDLIPDIVRGGDEAAGAWQRFARALEDAAIQALAVEPILALLGLGGGTQSLGGGVFGGLFKLLGFAEGGMHYGLGGPRADRQLARVSPGEFTVNARGTQKHRALLEAINSGAPIPGFAAGGHHGAAPIASAPVVLQPKIIDQTSRGLRLEPDGSETTPEGIRLERYIAQDYVGGAVTATGGRAQKAMQRTYGLSKQRPRR